MRVAHVHPLLWLLCAACGTPPELPDGGRAMCFADFPCRPGETTRCVSDTEFAYVMTHECHFSCGPDPCSGGTCDTVGPRQACPSGQRCLHGTTPGVFDHCGGSGDDAGADGGDAASGDAASSDATSDGDIEGG